MTNVDTIDFAPWTGSSADELGYGLSDGKKITTHRHTNSARQQFNILEIDARRAGRGPTILSATSFDYRIDPMLERRMAVFAHHAGARVIVSELPGVTMDRSDPMKTRGDFQTPTQTFMATTGNYDPLATAQLEAIEKEIGFENGEEIQLFGESLGAYCVASMARVIAQGGIDTKLHISKVDMFEPVNSFGNVSLIKQFDILNRLKNIEAPRHEFYFHENDLIGHGDITAFERLSPETAKQDAYVKRRQFLFRYGPGAGLRKGMDTAILDALKDKTEAGARLHEAEITFWRTADSSVTKTEDLEASVQQIHEAKGRARSRTVDAAEGDETEIGHHSLTSLGRLASYSLLRAKE